MKPIDTFYYNTYVLGTLSGLGLPSLEALACVKPTGETMLDQLFIDCREAFEQKITFDDIFAKQEENQKLHPELVIFYSYLKTALQFYTGSFTEFKKPALLYAIVSKGDLAHHEIQKMYVQKELEIYLAVHPLKQYFIELEPSFAEDTTIQSEVSITNEQLFPTTHSNEPDPAVVEKITNLCEMMGMDTSQSVSELSWFGGVLEG